MNKLSIAAVLAASALALQAPLAQAAGDKAGTSADSSTTQSSGSQQGVPGVELNAGSNASDRGVPGVEMNVGRDGDQRNIGQGSNSTSTLGAGPDTGTSGSATTRPMRTDRN